MTETAVAPAAAPPAEDWADRLLLWILVGLVVLGIGARAGSEAVAWLRWRQACAEVGDGRWSASAFAAGGRGAAAVAPLAAQGGGRAGGVWSAPGPGEPVVHVTGAVKTPGVYRLEVGARVKDAVVAAGGPADGAALDYLNLAEAVADGSRVYVPTEEEVRKAQVPPLVMGAAAGGAAGVAPGVGSAGVTGSAKAAGKININTADAATLQQLPGVGPVTAARILSYRQQYGPFMTPEDLKNVPGIGEKRFAEMAPLITVK